MSLIQAILTNPESPTEYIALAKTHWSNYKFEEYTRCLLSCLYQRKHISEKFSIDNNNHTFKNLKVVLACGGRGSRWRNFMGISKQFVDCGDGVPLIQRTVDQFTKILPGANFFLLIGEDQVKEFAPIKGCHRLLRHHPSDFPLGTEVFGYQASKVLHNSDILLLYGDVYFTDNALRLIKDACITSMEFKAFGRKNKNPENWNNGGEDFGLFMPKERNSFILGWYQLTGDIYTGSRLFRFSPWEVISLISWAHKKGIKSAAEFRLTGTNPGDASNGILQTFNDREFDKNLWVEIDDDTEDFDFPIEYMTRLLLMAERMQ